MRRNEGIKNYLEELDSLVNVTAISITSLILEEVPNEYETKDDGIHGVVIVCCIILCNW
jgi:hypothetical protein